MPRSQSQQHPRTPDHGLVVWLAICCMAIFAMVVIGGVTRLTGSGLSMVEWRPLMGLLPPMTAGEWERVFTLYKASPQFQLVNLQMSLAEFQNIFWWEYVHRLWGRLIGLIFVLPLIWFAVRRRIGRRLGFQLFGLLMLGLAQGLLGWYMVKSGLVDRPEVSQYRLTAHLALALLLYAALFMTALSLLPPRAAQWSSPERIAARRLRPFTAGLIFVVVMTILAGGFMAGTDAGRIYNTYPLMDGRLFPPGYFRIDPWLLNPFENVIAVNFNHRWLGTITALFTGLIWLLGRRLASGPRRITNAVSGVVAVQFGLGITTLLTEVPVAPAALHQAGAVLLLTVTLWLYHALARSAD